MYKEFNFTAVPQAEYLANKKAIHTMNDYWTKSTIEDIDGNSVEVFNEFVVYSKGSGVTTGKGAKAIYKMVGTSQEELTSEEWKGVDDAFFYFKPVDFDVTTVTGLELYNALGSGPSDTMYTENTVTFRLVTDSKQDISDVKELLANRDPDAFDGFIQERGEDVDNRWHIAYADIDGDIFKDFSISVPAPVYTPSTAKKVNNAKAAKYKKYGIGTRGTWTQVIQLTYTMKNNVYDRPAADYDAVFQRVKSNDLWPTAWYSRVMLDDNADPDLPVGINGAELFAKEIVVGGKGNNTNGIKIHLRADAFNSIHIKKVAAFFKSMFAFDYDETPAPWWAKLIVAIVIIIIVIVAVLLAIPSGGTSIYVAVAAIAGVVSLAATAISLVLTLYANWLQARGMYRQAAAVGRTIVVMNDIAKWAGYISMTAGLLSIISNGGMQEISAEAGKQAIKDGSTQVVQQGGRYLIKVSWESIAQKVASAINAIDQEVFKYMAEEDDKAVADAQATIDEQERIMNEYASPTNLARLVASKDVNAYAEGLDALDVMAYTMTQSTLDKPFNLYYS